MLSRSGRGAVRVLVAGALSASVVLVASQAGAQITDDEADCRSSIVRAMSKYIDATETVINGCHQLRDAGELGPEIDCNDADVADTNTEDKWVLAQAAASAQINAACQDVPSVLSQYVSCPAPWEATDDGGADGIDTLQELTSCLILQGKTAIESALQGAMGLPEGLSTSQAKCHAAVGKAVARVVDTTIKERGKCQKELDKDGGPLSFQCADADPKLKIASTLTKAEHFIEVTCSDAGEAAAIDSCATDVSGIQNCAIATSAKDTGAILATMIWEIPGA